VPRRIREKCPATAGSGPQKPLLPNPARRPFVLVGLGAAGLVTGPIAPLVSGPGGPAPGLDVAVDASPCTSDLAVFEKYGRFGPSPDSWLAFCRTRRDRPWPDVRGRPVGRRLSGGSSGVRNRRAVGPRRLRTSGRVREKSSQPARLGCCPALLSNPARSPGIWWPAGRGRLGRCRLGRRRLPDWRLRDQRLRGWRLRRPASPGRRLRDWRLRRPASPAGVCGAGVLRPGWPALAAAGGSGRVLQKSGQAAGSGRCRELRSNATRSARPGYRAGRREAASVASGRARGSGPSRRGLLG
jgi:hypothetical protein